MPKGIVLMYSKGRDNRVGRFVQSLGVVLGGVRRQEGEEVRLWRLDKEVEEISVAILGGLGDIFLKRKVLSVPRVA